MADGPEGFGWTVLAGEPAAGPRAGLLRTPHGEVRTPAFIPVATRGVVKGVRPETLRALGVQMVLANTYHLMLRPGAETVRALGGLHALSGWDGPMLTDSGGYQVFSLAERRQVDEEGVRFRSHIDGAEVRLAPETAVAVQNALGADIIMALDVCPPYPCPREEVERAVRLTLDWAARCRSAHRRRDQALWGIVQGGVEEDLRRRSAEALVAMDFPGYAVGGVSVGEGHENLRRVLEWTVPLLPASKPRYLMGVGEVRDVVAAVERGIDLFDCVLPTRNGRNAFAFTFDGPLRLRNRRFRTDRRPIEQGCDCPACRRFSRGALRHFFQAEEMLGPILVSIHNLRFYTRLFAALRTAVVEGRFTACAQALLDRYYGSD